MNEKVMDREFIFPTQTPVGRLKSNALWRAIVLILAPIFEFAWEYIFNFKEKILYLSSPYKGALRPLVKKNRLEVLRNDPQITEFAQAIKAAVTEDILKRRRDEMLAKKEQEAYFMNIHNDLDESTRLKMLEFAMSDRVLREVLPYFKVAPRLNSIQLMYNIVRPEFSEVGSKMWHQDDGYYKSLSYFICISDIDDDSGPFHGYEHPESRHSTVPLDKVDTRLSVWMNQRHSNERMAEFKPDSQIHKLTGPTGTAILVDNGLCYHKGGYCKKKERLFMQIHFSAEIPWLTEPMIRQLELENNPEVDRILNSPIKKYIASGGNQSWIRRLAVKLHNPSFLLGRRILCFYPPPLRKS